MRENENQKVKVKIERHKWPDEINVQKQNNRAKATTVILFSLVFFVFGIFFAKSILVSSDKVTSNSKFEMIQDIMTKEWYFGKDVEDLETKIKDNALYGLSDVFEIDPHTTYLSAAEMSQYTSNLSGAYVGIGIQYYQAESGSFIVQRVFENSPAQKGGILAGDILVKVDHDSIVDLEMNEVADLVMGLEDTDVVITVLRDAKEMDFTLTRARVLHSVYGQVIDDIGYIELDQFGESSASEVLNYLNKFENKQNKLILDLRDNGGGYLDTVIDIASLLIPKNETALITEDIKGNQYFEKTNSDKTFTFEKIVVLVNQNTASASEVLTIALMEHLDNVVVVGSKTYGKGTVQQSRIFDDGSALKYTTAEWLSPNGNKINKVGITPDEIVELHPILSMDLVEYRENKTFEVDSVGAEVMIVQNALDFLGYNVERTDGYFDNSTLAALKAFESDIDVEIDGVITADLYDLMISRTIREWTANKNAYDKQLDMALVIMGEK